MNQHSQDNVSGSQLEMSTTFLSESSQPRQCPTRAVVKKFVMEVKDTFKYRSQKYREFLDLMIDFNRKRIDIKVLVTRVKKLFKDDRHLMEGMNILLPEGYEMILPPKEESSTPLQRVIFDLGIDYVKKVKKRFRDDVQSYKDFLKILSPYNYRSKSTAEVYQEVADLFCEDQDLVEEFLYFLPDIRRTTSSAPS